MLVRRGGRADEPGGESGSVLIVVLVVMLVLTIGGVALAAIVTNTTRSLLTSRSTAESRAAADAGLAAAVAKARSTREFCGATDPGTFAEYLPATTAPPRYTVQSRCTGNRVTFVSEGRGARDGVTRTEAVYEFVPVNAGGSAELVFFNGSDPADSSGIDLTRLTVATDPLGRMVFAGPASVSSCHSGLDITIVARGSLTGGVGCRIAGSLHLGGSLTLDGQIEGDVTASGDVTLGRFDEASPTDGTYVRGSVTLPATETLTAADGQIFGGIERPPSVASPTLPGWFDYEYSASDWTGRGFASVEIPESDCGDLSESPEEFWTTTLPDVAQRTVFDLTACADGLSSVADGGFVVDLPADVAIIAPRFVLSDLTVRPAAGADASLWLIVPDTTNDLDPTCSDGDIVIDATVRMSVKTMAYTPCAWRLDGGGSWRGAVYAGALRGGGALSIAALSMLLPGQPVTPASGADGSGEMRLGALVSQRDLP